MILQIFSAKVSRQRTAEYGKVHGKEIHQASADGAVPGHDAVAVGLNFIHLEIVGSDGL